MKSSPSFTMSELRRALGDTRVLQDASLLHTTATAAEAREDWPAAHLAWERIIDRSPATPAQLFEAIEHIHALRAQIQPINSDPSKARSWRTLAVLFRHLDFTWRDKTGIEHHVKTTLTTEDEQRIRRSLAAFAQHVFRLTDGVLRVDLTVTVVDQPLTKLEGTNSFGPGLDNLRPIFNDVIGDRQFDCALAYVKFRESREYDVPAAFSASACGGDIGPKGTPFVEIPWNPAVEFPIDGELELHEWLHHVDMIWMHILGYPYGIHVNPDDGRFEDQTGGDPTYRHPRGEKSWMGFYEHIMQCHNTRLMWSELTVRNPDHVFWGGGDLKDWLTCGPFAGDGTNATDAMEQDFIGETSVRPVRDATSAGQKWTRRFSRSGRLTLDLPAEQSGGIVYASSTIACGASDWELILRHDYPLKIWANGKQVYASPAASQQRISIPISLPGGQNTLLFKIGANAAPRSLQARLMRADHTDDWGFMNVIPGNGQ